MAALACAAAACGVLSAEEQVLADFFRAARLRDTTIMARLSVVDFDPRTDGVVERFAVVESRTSNADTRVVTLDARVRRGGGPIGNRRLTVTLHRVDSRWRIAELAEHAAPR